MTSRVAGRPPGRLNGDDLIAEVLRNMEEGLFRIRRKTIVPSIYRIYLNSQDYEPFRDVVPFIAGEIRAALDDSLAKWNGSKRNLPLAVPVRSLLGKIGVGDSAPPSEFVRVSDSWTVEIYPDLDEKLQPGEIEVYSELGTPEKPEYGAGSLTRRIFPRASDTGKPAPAASAPSSEVSETIPPDSAEFDAAPTVATVRSPAASAEMEAESPNAGSEANNSEDDPQDHGTKGRAFAYLRYADQQGEKTFEVTRNQIVIGRGGRSYWVDLRLETLPDVSREHCRIRRDPETGRFTIEDTSQFGTAVNGKPVLQGAPAEIPRRATISLAGVIDLQWEAL